MNKPHTDAHSHHFVVPTKYYVVTYFSLLILTVITVWVAQFDFGALNLAVALIVALIKAAFVSAIFMGLRWEKGFNLIVFASCMVFVGIFFLLTFADMKTRHYTDPVEGVRFGFKTPVNAAAEHTTVESAIDEARTTPGPDAEVAEAGDQAGAATGNQQVTAVTTNQTVSPNRSTANAAVSAKAATANQTSTANKASSSH